MTGITAAWAVFRVLNDPNEGVGAKAKVMATNPWGIAMLVMFAPGVVGLVQVGR